jgi:hypothetical protein
MPPALRAWHWLRDRPYTSLGIVAAVVLSVAFCRRHDSEWESVYLPAAERLWRGEDVYLWGGAYLYPPFFAWAALPFLALPAAAVRPAWLAVNLACLAAMLRWGWRLAGGGPLEGRPAAPTAGPREHLATLAGAACGIFYIQNCLAHQQTDLVLGALLTGGCLLLGRGRPLAAATCYGLAAAGKCTALLFAPYLLWRGRPAAAAWLVCVAVGVNLLPDLVRPAPCGRPWAVEYAVRLLRPLTARDHYVGTWGSEPVYNQSLAGAGQRWALTTWSWDEDDCRILPRPRPIGPRTLRVAVHALQFTLLLAVLHICGRPLRRIVEGPAGGPQALECAIVLLLMLLFSPMSSKAHFGTLVVPGFCLARAAAAGRTPRSRVLGVLVLTAVLLGVLSNKDLLGERLYTLSLWYGVVTWQVLVLLVGCLLAQRPAAPPALPCPEVQPSSRSGRIGRAGISLPWALGLPRPTGITPGPAYSRRS